ncbi:MAG: hypothetical protein HYS61_05295, partial [Acidobacteria bacterium]|nr:hypothetical protein [Acidobacteriota bacterium]
MKLHPKRPDSNSRILALLAAVVALGATLAFWTGQPGVSGKESKPAFSAEEFQANVKFLAGDGLKGRGNGTQELDAAADFIAERFRKFGLKPAGDGGTYFQRFMMTVGAKLGPKNSLSFEAHGSSKELTLKKDYVPFSFSAHGTFEGPLVFMGYGIT